MITPPITMGNNGLLLIFEFMVIPSACGRLCNTPGRGSAISKRCFNERRQGASTPSSVISLSLNNITSC